MSEQRLLQWLAGAAAQPDGRVFAWRNPDHEGRPYAEAAGFLLTLWSLDGAMTESRNSIAAGLAAEAAANQGCGKQGARYLFDTAIVLGALDTHTRKGGEDFPEARRALLEFSVQRLQERSSFVGDDGGEPDRWSRRFGAHLIKACARIAAQGGAPERLARERARELLGLFDGERFHIDDSSPRTYLHANTYALEGLVLLEESAEVVRAGAHWLAAEQTETGGLHAWHDGRTSHGALRSDVTAQAVRLWNLVDASLFQDSIARGCRFLKSLQAPGGGLYYEEGSNDINCWSTVFGVQALRWSREDCGSTDELV